jgi:hypothetical protein
MNNGFSTLKNFTNNPEISWTKNFAPQAAATTSHKLAEQPLKFGV